jgi:hypothetical protein
MIGGGHSARRRGATGGRCQSPRLNTLTDHRFSRLAATAVVQDFAPKGIVVEPMRATVEAAWDRLIPYPGGVSFWGGVGASTRPQTDD